MFAITTLSACEGAEVQARFHKDASAQLMRGATWSCRCAIGNSTVIREFSSMQMDFGEADAWCDDRVQQDTSSATYGDLTCSQVIKA